MRKKTLKWGRTPWDKMSRENLLREIQRMYSALLSVNCALRLTRFQREESPFYGKRGTGGTALEKARQILDPLHDQYKNGDEELYRAFFRYADDLLFDRSGGFQIGAGWAVCPVCGTMLGETIGSGESMVGKKCSEKFPTQDNCPGIFRPLTWEDLALGVRRKGETEEREL